MAHFPRRFAGILNRFFFVIERFAYRRSLLVISVSLVLAIFVGDRAKTYF